MELMRWILGNVGLYGHMSEYNSEKSVGLLLGSLESPSMAIERGG